MSSSKNTVESNQNENSLDSSTMLIFVMGILAVIILVLLVIKILQSITGMSKEEAVIAEQISDEVFRPTEFPQIKSVDIEVQCPAVANSTAKDVMCDIHYTWLETKEKISFMTPVPMGAYKYAFNLKFETITHRLPYGPSRYTYEKAKDIDLGIDEYTQKSTDLSRWISNRVTDAIRATANKPEIIEASKKEQIALSYE